MLRLSTIAEDQLLSYALRLYEAHRYDDALAFLRMLDADDPTIAKLMASCWQRRGDRERAANLYERVLARCPDDCDALTNLGEIHLARLAFDDALAVLRHAIGLDPLCQHPASLRARALVMNVVQTWQAG